MLEREVLGQYFADLDGQDIHELLCTAWIGDVSFSASFGITAKRRLKSAIKPDIQLLAPKMSDIPASLIFWATCLAMFGWHVPLPLRLRPVGVNAHNS
ncbi:MAG: hypothetical protein WAT12_10475 [Candidatus Nitrotoga sp.]